MDPDETFTAMMEARACGMHDEAVEHAENLKEWLSKGGFAPSFRMAAGDRSTFTVDGSLSRRFCEAACDTILSDPVINPSPEF